MKTENPFTPPEAPLEQQRVLVGGKRLFAHLTTIPFYSIALFLSLFLTSYIHQAVHHSSELIPPMLCAVKFFPLWIVLWIVLAIGASLAWCFIAYKIWPNNELREIGEGLIKMPGLRILYDKIFTPQTNSVHPISKK